MKYQLLDIMSSKTPRDRLFLIDSPMTLVYFQNLETREIIDFPLAMESCAFPVDDKMEFLSKQLEIFPNLVICALRSSIESDETHIRFARLKQYSDHDDPNDELSEFLYTLKELGN